MNLVAALLLAAFPLAEGTQWVYRGTIRGDFKRADIVRRVTTTMRVVRHEVIGKYEVALIDGDPSSISCEAVDEPRRLFTVIIRDGRRYYEIATPNPVLFDDEEEVAKAVETAALLVEFPLRDHAERVASHKILGKTRQPYAITVRTLPDHTITEFVEGIGITRSQYVHHGSPCEVDLKLVAMH